MNAVEFMRTKALMEFYEGLSADERKEFLNLYSTGDPSAQTGGGNNGKSFGLGVLENVVGNAAYDVFLTVLRKLMRSCLR